MHRDTLGPELIIYAGNKDVVSTLISFSANIHAKDNQGSVIIIKNKK